MQIFHTRNREATARALAERYDRVLIRNKNVLWNPLRLRRAKLADLNPFIVLNPSAFDAQLKAWNRDGGLLIYDRDFTVNEDVAAHQAQVVSECPVSIAHLEKWIEGTREVVVIYRPPTWEEHWRWIRNSHPGSEICRALYDLISAAPAREDLAAALELPRGAHAVSDRAATEALALGHAQLIRVRRALLRPRDFKGAHLVALRVAPEDRSLARVYSFIENECPVVDGLYLVVGKALAKKVQFWKLALRALERVGAIAVKDELYFYWLDELPPNWMRIDAHRRRAEEDLAVIITHLEASPEFNLPPASHSPQSRFLPRRSQSMSAA